MKINPLLIHAVNVVKFGQEYAVILDPSLPGIAARNRNLPTVKLLKFNPLNKQLWTTEKS